MYLCVIHEFIRPLNINMIFKASKGDDNAGQLSEQRRGGVGSYYFDASLLLLASASPKLPTLPLTSLTSNISLVKQLQTSFSSQQH